MANEKIERGTVISLDFSPQAGYEMKEKHPALIISPLKFNERSRFIICCPITSTIRNSPWEVKIPNGLTIRGCILVDQVKSIDKQARRVTIEDQMPKEIVDIVIEKLQLLLS